MLQKHFYAETKLVQTISFLTVKYCINSQLAFTYFVSITLGKHNWPDIIEL